MFNRGEGLSIFSKVLMVFLIVVLPMYFLSVYVTIKGQNGVRDEILKSAESKGDFYLSSLETQLYNVFGLQLNILNDSRIQTLQQSGLELTLADRLITLNYIRDMLRYVKNMNAYIDDIYVFIPNVNTEVTTERVMALDPARYEKFLKFSSVENLPFCEIDSRYYINMIPEFYSKYVHEIYKGNPFLVSIRIDEKAVKGSMEDIVGMVDGGSFLLSDGRGLALSSSGRDDILSAIENFEMGAPLKEKCLRSLKIDGTKYQVFFNPSNFLHSTLVIYVPESSFFAALKTFDNWVWSMSMIALILVAIFSLWIKGMIVTPLSRLVDSLKQVEDGDVDIQVSYSKNDEFGYLYSQFNYLANKLKILIGDIFKKELLLKDAEFKQLQYQINPHFLYNSLVVVYGLIRLNDSECALKMTKHLSNYYQYITRDATGDVTLQQELNHAMDFIEIQNIRFQGRISCEIGKLPENMKHFYVPKLILQPIIENVYKYGLKNKISHGLLRITFSQSQKYFEIMIEDNGTELPNDRLMALIDSMGQENKDQILGTGIKNVHDRLKIKFQGESGIKLGRSALGGLAVRLVIFMGDDINV